MNRQKILGWIVAIGGGMLAGHAIAEGASIRREGFVGVYAASCVKHLSSLSVLRESLANNPRLEEKHSRDILLGFAGDTWLLPADRGFFVVALATSTPLCVITRMDEDIESTRQEFEQFASIAPPPFVAKRLEGNPIRSTATTNVITYTWGLPGASWVYVLKLVTESSERTGGKPLLVGIAARANKGSPTELEAAIPIRSAHAIEQRGGT